MKLKDVKIGQILNDRFGNKFEVKQIDNGDDFMPIKLKCVEFVKDIYTSRDKITEVGYHSWFLKDRTRILFSNSTIGEFLKEHFYSDGENNSSNDDDDDDDDDGLELIDITLNDVKCRFLFGNTKAVKKVVTLDDLYIYEEYPTKNNTRIDDIIVDKFGVEYRVIAKYGTNGIEVVYSTEFTGLDDRIFDVNTKMHIPFYNSSYSDNILTTKEFKKK